MTLKQKMFIKRYIEFNGNGTKAALEVYDTTNHYSAAVIACQNMAKPEIRQEVDLLFEETYGY